MQNQQNEKLKILFFGLGSIGNKHARIIKEKYNHKLFAFRTKKGQVDNNFKIKEFFKIESAFETKPDVAFITNPTYLHIQTAHECIKRNTHLFIEKPISHSIENIDKIDKEIKKRHLITYVAYNLRFHPVLEKIKEITKNKKPIYFKSICKSYLPSWRDGQDYTRSYSAKKELGGGVLLDLSHEIDYITWIFGDIIKIDGYCDKISNLKINCEDIFEGEITSKTGVKGNIHLDYFTKKTKRTIEIQYDNETIEGDLLNNTIKIIKNNKEKISKLNYENDITYEKQIEYFFKQYHNKNEKMMNNYSEALKTFKKIMKFKNNNYKI